MEPLEVDGCSDTSAHTMTPSSTRVMSATLNEQPPSTPAGENQWNMRPAVVSTPAYAATVRPSSA
eukprot:350628-Chlamydomonas_euryale.AAC.2